MRCVISVIGFLVVAFAAFLGVASMIMAFSAVSGSTRKGAQVASLHSKSRVSTTTEASAEKPTSTTIDTAEDVGVRVTKLEPGRASFLFDVDQGDVVFVPSSELREQTHKWDGRTVETTANCFHADKGAFRCMAGGRASIDFSELEPYDARDDLEKNCDTLERAFSDRCTVTIRFIYESFEEMEIGASGRVTLVRARDDLARKIHGRLAGVVQSFDLA
jgi:hypothetical protein